MPSKHCGNFSRLSFSLAYGRESTAVVQDAQDVASFALEHVQACRSRWRLLCCNKGDFQQSRTALGFLESSHRAAHRLFPGLFTPSLGLLHRGHRMESPVPGSRSRWSRAWVAFLCGGSDSWGLRTGFLPGMECCSSEELRYLLETCRP